MSAVSVIEGVSSDAIAVVTERRDWCVGDDAGYTGAGRRRNAGRGRERVFGSGFVLRNDNALEDRRDGAAKDETNADDADIASDYSRSGKNKSIC